jgi:hypothetical protein
MALVGLVSVSSAQFNRNTNELFGPEVGLFFPADSVLRNRIGSQWTTIGLGGINPNEGQRKVGGTNFNIISGSSAGNKIFLGAYTLGIVEPLGDTRRRGGVVPYFALRGGISYSDYAVTVATNNRVSGKRVGWNGNAELGFIWDSRLALTARYDLFPRYDGLRFDGLSVSLRYGLFNF